MAKLTKKNDESIFAVHRTIVVRGLNSEHDSRMIRQYLERLKGMSRVVCNVERQRLTLVYDAAQLNFRTIEDALVASHHPVSETRWARLKAGLYRYLDENAKANMASKGGACCSNPSEIYARRQK